MRRVSSIFPFLAFVVVITACTFVLCLLLHVSWLVTLAACVASVPVAFAAAIAWFRPRRRWFS